MNKIIKYFSSALLAVLLTACSGSGEKSYSIDFFATNDVHGSFFSEPYVDGDSSHPSLSNVSTYIRMQRDTLGESNVVLIDVGDNLQGDNAAYYANYKDTTSGKHLLSRIFGYMKYDAVVVGNHDIETGHRIYDKIKNEIGIPYLAANAIDEKSGKPYFQPYSIIEKNGVKIAVIGMENPNIHKWLSPDLWSGIEFRPIYPMVDSVVASVKRIEKPDITVLAIHAGFGTYNSYDIENPARFIAANVKGVDAVFAAHDHLSKVEKIFNGTDSVLVIESGSKCRNLSHVKVTFSKKWGVISGKTVKGEIVPMKNIPADAEYDELFRNDYEQVKSFTNVKIGYLANDIDISEALIGMSDYLNFVHLAQLYASGADISISAPFSKSGIIKKGNLIYQNLFDLYPFENQLYMLTMTGRELQRYLEASYDSWVKMKGPAFDYDSAAGIIYTVSREAENGSRVKIKSMADGTPFDQDKTYTVAMTSYRASGAGDLLAEAWVDVKEIDERIIKRYPEIRELLYQYLLKIKTLDSDVIAKDSKLGKWNFVK